ncbi:MAG TPA: hypothetical protein VFZ53_07850 [Polyangiaceae bacterium]
MSARSLLVLSGLAVACGPDTISLGYDEPVVNRGTMPAGAVSSCYGDGCPYGECDNEEFVTDVDCDDVYPGPVDDTALFCEPTEEDDYCLVLGGGFSEEYWLVRCEGETATATQCGSGCSGGTTGARCL